MGIYTDFLAASKTIAQTDGERVGNHRDSFQELNSLRDYQGDYQGDLPYPSGYEAGDEVQSIAQHVTDGGGTYDIDFSLADGTTFSVDDIAWNESAANIQTAVDSAAATASVPDYQAGDIAIAGEATGLAADTLTITYTGSVGSQNHGEVVIDDTNLEDGGGGQGEAGAVSTAAEGQPNRPAWAILKATGAIAGVPPVYGATGTVTAGDSSLRGGPNYPSEDLIRTLANEAAIADGNPLVENLILVAAGLS